MQVSESTALRWRNSAAAPPARGIVACMLARVRAILRGLCAGHQARIGRRQLQSMSDWQLKDIGIGRCEIERWTRAFPARPRRSGHAED